MLGVGRERVDKRGRSHTCVLFYLDVKVVTPTAFGVSKTNFDERGIQQIAAVPRAIHPALNRLPSTFVGITIVDIFRCARVLVVGASEANAESASVRARVGEEAVLGHVVGMGLSSSGKLGIVAETLQTKVAALGICVVQQRLNDGISVRCMEEGQSDRRGLGVFQFALASLLKDNITTNAKK